MKKTMTRRNFVTSGTAAACGLTLSASNSFSAPTSKSVSVTEEETIVLLPPQKEGGMPLFEALAKRKTNRAIRPEMLDLSTLSNLLWAADGVNREDGRRTAPTALNSQEILIFVMLAGGVYAYDPAAHQLKRVAKGSFRNLAGTQEYSHSVPVTFIYAADLSRSLASEETRATYAAVDCGFIGQNVYLFAAAMGLAAVFRGSIDRKGLADLLKLTASQFVLYAQSIGFPDEEKAQAAPIRLIH